MHWICSTFGSHGDVFPMLGVAAELRRRGHRVTFATNDYYAPMAKECGFDFEPLGSEADIEQFIRDPDLWNPRRGFQRIFEALRPHFRRQYELHAELAGSKEVAAITNCLGFGAFMARDQGILPVVTLHVQPGVIWSDYEPPTLPGVRGPRWLQRLLFRFGERFYIDATVGASLNAWRKELGLPKIQRCIRWWNSDHGVVCLFPEWFAPRQPDWPRKLVQTDFPLWNFRSDTTLDPAVQQFLQAGPAPIVFTPGSANVHGRQFFANAVEACGKLESRGILLTNFPEEQLPASLPPNIAHFAYVPLDQLLPHAAAFVHHGGIGSTSQAMLAGIPQLLIPMAHDQFDNAARVRKLQLGSSIYPEPRTGTPIATALKQLLTSHEVRDACRTAKSRLTRRDGIPHAVDTLENWFPTPSRPEPIANPSSRR